MSARRKQQEPPRRDRAGYYTLPSGQRCMSVTTILSNGVPKPALVHWAASEVAHSAIDNLPRLSRVRGADARATAYDWLRKAAERKRDTAADLGSSVHDIVEADILGKPMPELTPEQQPFLGAYANFITDWQPVFESTELVAAHPEDGWCGTLDWLGVLPRLGTAVVLGDWKTGKGVYADACLQLSAYRHATTGWTKDGKEVALPEIERAVIVHIRPDKYPDRGYAVYPADTSDDVYACFLAARDIALRWVKGLSETALGESFEAAEDRQMNVESALAEQLLQSTENPADDKGAA